ncbi:glycosyltransferase involved in cell wall biosynthesis [Puniceicoccus vermicola]|uniref:Glycosyltransferase n=1 Tax=Puniceicoccus vermicola TaxID=388746 RepID=A0A7X1B0P9_9BACT|nr:glycosyltransferase [Puniceicoccus vermicola]
MGLRSEAHTKGQAPEVLYLCTTFPRLSETFVEREVRHLHKTLPLRIVSIWKGGEAPDLPVQKIPLLALLTLFGRIPFWLLRKPSGLLSLLQLFFHRFPRSFLNLEETLLGMGMGMILADQVRKNRPAWIHAIWATAPTTAALTLHKLTGVSFSFGAHAYDLFQDGGDCLLREKIRAASWIRTSTLASKQELIARGATPDKIVLIRRGLQELPDRQTPRPATGKVRLLSIGRLVAKKGYSEFIELCDELRKRGVPFNAIIIGDGPLREELQRKIVERQLGSFIQLTGALPRPEVEPYFQNSDLFVFTGVVSKDGDRDGLPNVVPEALAHGLPVMVRPALGVLEAITHEETGVVFEEETPSDWADQLLEVWEDHPKRVKLSETGRRWVEENFLSQNNTSLLAEKILSSQSPPPKGPQR